MREAGVLVLGEKKKKNRHVKKNQWSEEGETQHKKRNTTQATENSADTAKRKSTEKKYKRRANSSPKNVEV